MSLENFREIDLFHNKTLFNTYEQCDNRFFYPIHNYYFGFNGNIISIFNENFELILMNDTLLSNNYNNLYLSLYNQKLVIQLINNNESSVIILNKDFTKYGREYIINQNKQIIYIWNNEPILIDYVKQSFRLYSTENTLFCEYKLPFLIKGYSNIICFNKDLYLLALLHDGLYVFIKLGEKLEYSNYFRIDYDNIGHISIDYYNDIWHIVILQNNNVITIKKKYSDISLIYTGDRTEYMAIPDFILHLANTNSIINNNNLNNLKNKIKNKWIDEIIFDFTSIPRFIPRTIKLLQIPVEKSIEIPKIIYIKSNKYFDYFKWIVENYDTSTNETVVFYNYLQYHINIEFLDNFIVNNLNMLEISNNVKTFILTMGKLSLVDGIIYGRSFKKIYSNENINLALICKEDKNDFYIPKQQISTNELYKILHFLISNNIKNTHHLYWTPFQYFKLDMKLIWNRSKDYWENIYNRLNSDLTFEKYMPYLFYNIING
jgi:hypothetical protein